MCRYSGDLDAPEHPLCTECGLGFYKQDTSNTPCSACPAGTNTSGNASERACDCECYVGWVGAECGPCTICEVRPQRSSPKTPNPTPWTLNLCTMCGVSAPRLESRLLTSASLEVCRPLLDEWSSLTPHPRTPHRPAPSKRRRPIAHSAPRIPSLTGGRPRDLAPTAPPTPPRWKEGAHQTRNPSQRQAGISPSLALSFRCRANTAHVRHSRPDSGLGLQVIKVLTPLYVVASSLGSGNCCLTGAIDLRRPPFGSGVVGPVHLSVDTTSLCESQLALMKLS